MKWMTDDITLWVLEEQRQTRSHIMGFRRTKTNKKPNVYDWMKWITTDITSWPFSS
jgi:hypothetical protein